MNPIVGLWKDTWYVWLLIGGVLAAGVYWVTAMFLVGFPALLAYFLYFAFIRYDQHGNKKSA
ncbi:MULTISPECIES: hypothetical protein [Bremerella]|uniref:hypothetical protein n=1 Tax=Bremerella TaxID=2714594 RepID=UPI0031E5D30F